MKLPSKDLELSILSEDFDGIIGVDEVGMGSLAGPVVTCAVLLTKDFYSTHSRDLDGVRDSKLLSANQREKYTDIIKKTPGIFYKITHSKPRTIDRINIHKASQQAMLRAIKELGIRKSRLCVLVDGPHKISGLKLPQKAIIKGDRKIFAISCASILAKTFRDQMMRNYAKLFKEYGFEKHKGYGTAIHKQAIITHGASRIHRMTFAPMSKLN